MSSMDSSSRLAVTRGPCHSIFVSSTVLSSTIGASTLFAAIAGKRWRLFSLYIYHLNSTDLPVLFGAGGSYFQRYAPGSGSVGQSSASVFAPDWPFPLSAAVNAVAGMGSYDVGGFTYIEAIAELLPMAFNTATGD